MSDYGKAVSEMVEEFGKLTAAHSANTQKLIEKLEISLAATRPEEGGNEQFSYDVHTQLIKHLHATIHYASISLRTVDMLS